DGFIFENVPSLIHPGQRHLFDKLLDEVRRSGYATNWGVLHAAEFGVPQRRSRLFVIGLRGKAAPRLPSPTRAWSAATVRHLPPPEAAGPWIDAFSIDQYAEPQEIVSGRWARE